VDVSLEQIRLQSGGIAALEEVIGLADSEGDGGTQTVRLLGRAAGRVADACRQEQPDETD